MLVFSLGLGVSLGLRRLQGLGYEAEVLGFSTEGQVHSFGLEFGLALDLEISRSRTCKIIVLKR